MTPVTSSGPEPRRSGSAKGLLGGTDQATLIVRKDARQRIGPSALTELAEMYLGNSRVSELDDRLQRA